MDKERSMREMRGAEFSNRLTRRSLLRVAAGAGLATVAGGLRGASAATPDFVIEGFGGSWGDKVQKVFVEPFQAQNPGTKIVFVGDVDDGVILSKMLLGCGHPDFAVSDVNTNVGPLMLDRGCIAGLDANLVPNLKHIAKEAILEAPGIGPYFASSYLGILGFVWNTKLAKKPTSWNDMWSPQYKGKIAIGDFSWTGQDWLPAISRLHGGDEDNVAPGIEAIAELVKKNDAVIAKSSDQMIQLFQSEAVVAAPFWNGRTGAMQKKGIPVAIEFVPNSIFIGDGYLIMKHLDRWGEGAGVRVTERLSAGGYADQAAARDGGDPRNRQGSGEYHPDRLEQGGEKSRCEPAALEREGEGIIGPPPLSWRHARIVASSKRRAHTLPTARSPLRSAAPSRGPRALSRRSGWNDAISRAFPSSEGLRSAVGDRPDLVHGRARRVHLALRPQRLRQDDDAAEHRGLHPADCGGHPHRRPVDPWHTPL
jgi:putative spermidine/putrescine transport system substrate-binding protein